MRIAFLLGLSSLLICRTLAGQEATAGATPKTPVIHTTTREVLVDLVVRDKHHHTITDLRPEEVEVYEDGVRQTIKVFRNVQGEEQLQTERSIAKSEAAAASSAIEQAHPVNSLRQVNFVSVVFAQIAPLDLEFAREAVLDFLKSDTLPNTYVTIYRLNQNLKLIQGYTSDKDALAKAVDAASKGVYAKDGLTASAGVVGAANALITANAANVIASPLATPDQAQAVQNQVLNPIPAIAADPLWARNAASEDVSVILGSALLTQAHIESGLRFASSLSNGMDAMDSLHALVHSQEKLPGRKVVLYLSDGLSFPVNRRDAVDALISHANRSGVSFYTVDTRGLNVNDPMMASLANMERAGAESSASKADPRNGHNEDDDVQLTAVSNDQMSMRELAERTGGFSVLNTNQIAEPMQRMMEDIRTHYELAYSPTSTNYDGHFRAIEVKVSRPKVTIQARKGYFALPELNGEPLQPFEMAALKAMNTHPAPVEFPYQSALLEFRSSQDAVQYEMAFEVPVSGLRMVADPKAKKARLQVSLVALIHDSSGEVVGKVSRDLAREVPATEVDKIGNDKILYAEPVELPAGHYIVDTAVTDEQAEKTTVRRISVFVDPGRNLGVSSVQVVRRFEPLTGPRDPQDPFELVSGRVTPTLAESVASGKPVALYFVVYPAKMTSGEDPKVVLQLFRDGKEVSRQPLELPKANADGSIPVLLQLSPDPGQLDIRVTAQQGTLVAQSSRSLKIE